MANRARLVPAIALLVLAPLGACSGKDTGSSEIALGPDPKPSQERRGEKKLEPTDEPVTTAPGVKPEPEPAAAPVNSVDTIVDDMRLMNDLPLAGVPSGPGWAVGPGHVVMGNDPRGTRTPSWWNPANASFKSDKYWSIVLPWLVVFDGAGNAAGNTRVEMRNLRVYAKSKASGKWIVVAEPTAVDGELYPKHLQGEETSTPDLKEAGSVSSVKPPGGSMVFHGWGTKVPIDGPDLRCLFVTVQARLTVDDPKATDDRAQAKYLIHVGADYYPDATTSLSAFAPAYYLPGVGLSRAKLVTNEWRAFNFTTIDVGVEDPGGASITEAELRAAPPPLE